MKMFKAEIYTISNEGIKIENEYICEKSKWKAKRQIKKLNREFNKMFSYMPQELFEIRGLKKIEEVDYETCKNEI